MLLSGQASPAHLQSLSPGGTTTDTRLPECTGWNCTHGAAALFKQRWLGQQCLWTHQIRHRVQPISRRTAEAAQCWHYSQDNCFAHASKIARKPLPSAYQSFDNKKFSCRYNNSDAIALGGQRDIYSPPLAGACSPAATPSNVVLGDSKHEASSQISLGVHPNVSRYGGNNTERAKNLFLETFKIMLQKSNLPVVLWASYHYYDSLKLDQHWLKRELQ